MNEVSLLAKSVKQRISNLHAIAHELKGLSDPVSKMSHGVFFFFYKYIIMLDFYFFKE